MNSFAKSLIFWNIVRTFLVREWYCVSFRNMTCNGPICSSLWLPYVLSVSNKFSNNLYLMQINRLIISAGHISSNLFDGAKVSRDSRRQITTIKSPRNYFDGHIQCRGEAWIQQSLFVPFAQLCCWPMAPCEKVPLFQKSIIWLQVWGKLFNYFADSYDIDKS